MTMAVWYYPESASLGDVVSVEPFTDLLHQEILANLHLVLVYNHLSTLAHMEMLNVEKLKR